MDGSPQGPRQQSEEVAVFPYNAGGSREGSHTHGFHEGIGREERSEDLQLRLCSGSATERRPI